jgi:hypothetical protein
MNKKKKREMRSCHPVDGEGAVGRGRVRRVRRVRR